MTLLDWHHTAKDHVTGRVRWSAAPGAVFFLELARDGRLVEWRATADEGRSLSARQLRAAPIGAMEREIRREVGAVSDVFQQVAAVIARVEDRWGIDLDRAVADLSAIWAKSLTDFAERPRTGPAGRGDRAYAELAALYVSLVDSGEPRPIRAVAGRVGLAEKTVQNHLFKARERGLLTSLGRGRAGGLLTDKAKEILNGTHS